MLSAAENWDDNITEIEFETDYNTFTISIPPTKPATLAIPVMSRVTNKDEMDRDRKVSFAANIGVKEISASSVTEHHVTNRATKFHDFMAADSFLLNNNQAGVAVPPTPWLIRDMFLRASEGGLTQCGQLKISTQERVVWGCADSVCLFVWGLRCNTQNKCRGNFIIIVRYLEDSVQRHFH